MRRSKTLLPQLLLALAGPLLALGSSGSALAGEGGIGLADEIGFIGLGALPGGGESDAFAISTDGEIVVGDSSSSATGSNGREAVAWTAQTGVLALGDLAGGAFRSRANAIDPGSLAVVGGSSSTASGSNGIEAFIFDAFAGDGDALPPFPVGLGSLPGGIFASEAFGVSLSGDVVVGSSSSELSGSNGSEAFIWTEDDGMLGLGSLPGGAFRSAALGVDLAGEVVVGSSSSKASGANGSEAFMWTEETGMVGLGSLPGGAFLSQANAVSLDGGVVVGGSSSLASGPNSAEAFRLELPESSGGFAMEGLGDLPGGIYASVARALSGDGEVVVGASDSFDGEEAFVWDEENGMRAVHDILREAGVLEVEGWRLLSATGVSADGTVVAGIGLDPTRNQEAWTARIAAPVPEPLGALQQLVALCTSAALLRRSSRRPGVRPRT